MFIVEGVLRKTTETGEVDAVQWWGGGGSNDMLLDTFVFTVEICG